MKFEYKSQAEIDAMTAEQAQDYAVKLRAHEAETRKQEIETAVNATKEALTTELTTVKEQLQAVTDRLDALKEAQGAATVSLRGALAKEIKERKAEIVEAIKSDSGKEVTLKANTTRASIATNPQDLALDGVGTIGRIARSLYNLFPKVPVAPGNHRGRLAYIDWDEDTIVKAAAAVAEGADFPESTAAFKGYTLDLQKIGDILPVTEEFLEDEVMAAAELEMFVQNNVEAKVDAEIVNGTGTSNRIKGLLASIPAYSAVASSLTDANIYDLVIKVMEDITATRGSKYRPDFVAMNIADINKLKLKKDANNNYVFNNLSDNRLQQLNIIEDNNITANTLVVGDSRYGRIYEMDGVTVSRGYKGDQFAQDLMSIKARKRLAFLIRANDATGFRKVTSISAALTTLASNPS